MNVLKQNCVFLCICTDRNVLILIGRKLKIESDKGMKSELRAQHVLCIRCAARALLKPNEWKLKSIHHVLELRHIDTANTIQHERSLVPPHPNIHNIPEHCATKRYMPIVLRNDRESSVVMLIGEWQLPCC